ncbi:MAG: calcium-binding protein [Paracoccaceae bacterium]
MARIRAFSPFDNIGLEPIVPVVFRPQFLETEEKAALDDRPRLVDNETVGTIGAYSVLVNGEFRRPDINDWTGRIETIAAFDGALSDTGLPTGRLAWTARDLNLSPIWFDRTHPIETAVEKALVFADVFVGSAGDDSFRAYGGADVLRGRGGDDRLKGDGGNDRLRGETGRDRLEGNVGDDVLFGGRGRDVMIGGRGDDAMRGGRGSDLFVFRDGHGDDVIRDFRPGRDGIAFRSGPERFADLEIEAAGRGALVSYGDGDSILLVGVDADALSRDDFAF